MEDDECPGVRAFIHDTSYHGYSFSYPFSFSFCFLLAVPLALLGSGFHLYLLANAKRIPFQSLTDASWAIGSSSMNFPSCHAAVQPTRHRYHIHSLSHSHSLSFPHSFVVFLCNILIVQKVAKKSSRTEWTTLSRVSRDKTIAIVFILLPFPIFILFPFVVFNYYFLRGK